MLCGENECGGSFLKEFFTYDPCPTSAQEETLQKSLQSLIVQAELTSASQQSAVADDDDDFIPRAGAEDLTDEDKRVYLQINERVREELYGEREKREEIKEEEREVLEALQSLILRIFRFVDLA
jgi:hypothetical protein